MEITAAVTISSIKEKPERFDKLFMGEDNKLGYLRIETVVLETQGRLPCRTREIPFVESPREGLHGVVDYFLLRRTRTANEITEPSSNNEVELGSGIDSKDILSTAK